MPTVSENNKQNYSRALFIRSLKHVDPGAINAPGAGVFIKWPLAALARSRMVGLAGDWDQTNRRLQAATILTLLWLGSAFPPEAALSTVIDADKQVDIVAGVQ